MTIDDNTRAEGGSGPQDREAASAGQDVAATGLATQGEMAMVPLRERVKTADAFKFAGLVGLLVLVGVILFFLRPYFSNLFEPGGFSRVLADVREAGPAGVLVLFGLQVVTHIVVFVPGEATQFAAGMLYGPWLGALIILVCCIISSAFIFSLVRKLGAPFVQSIVPVKHLARFREFEKTNKLSIVVFVLFLIPGLPKDTFTYLVPLTDMRMRDFLLLSNTGRIPGIVVSTYAASGIMEGRIWESVAIFVVAAALAVVGLFHRDKIMDFLGKGR
ncbi:MAG: VTT domain-containing protein [Eggerthellaceae bacterium]|jgi:uncharacterized membrane protein YdjX (TVP38/TMEM64 family)|nr:VTT domain-containing protein [Eggerthellaceae bacterium]MDR2716433.1 VTT domain-containing protein [Coriobacteriaceae bacterium]